MNIQLKVVYKNINSFMEQLTNNYYKGKYKMKK